MEKRKLLSLIILFAFLILGIIYLKDHLHELKNILEVDLNAILILIFLALLVSICAGLKFKVLMEIYDIKLRLKEWWGLMYITHFINYITPFRGGTSTRSIYLKQKYGFPYTFSATTIGIDYITSFVVYGFCGIILSLMSPVPVEYKLWLVVIFVITFVIGIASLFLLPLIPKTDVKILKYIVRSVHELKHIRRKKPIMLKLLLLEIVGLILNALRIYYGFKAYNTSIPFSICLIIGLLSSSPVVMGITPMGLGVRESVIIIMAKLSGISAMLGLYAGTLTRATSMINVFILGPIFSFILLKIIWIKEKNASSKPDNIHKPTRP